MPAKLAGYLKRNKGPLAKLAGYLKRDKEARAKLHVSGQTSPAAEAALIFFCFLFFYQEKKRRDAFCEKEGMPAKLAGYLKRNKGPPAKFAGYLKGDKETSCQVAGDNHALEKSTRLTARPSAGCTFRFYRFAIPFYSLLRLSIGLALAARQF